MKSESRNSTNRLKSILTTIPENSQEPILLLHAKEEGYFTITHGIPIGRDGLWSDYFSRYETISRLHACFHYDKQWMVEDLDSTNGTYLNDIRIPTNQRVPVKDRDIVSFSKTCSVTIRIKE